MISGQIILGTIGNAVATASIDNSNGSIGISFGISRCFDEETFDAERYYDEYTENLPVEELWNICCELQCAPKDMVRALAEHGDEISDILDCSILPLRITADSSQHRDELSYYRFLAENCGQIDLSRFDVKSAGEVGALEKIIEFWKEHQLQPITPELERELWNLTYGFPTLSMDEAGEFLKGWINDGVLNGWDFNY